MAIYAFDILWQPAWGNLSAGHLFAGVTAIYIAYLSFGRRKKVNSLYNEPPMVPYKWPFFGHAFEFEECGVRFLDQCREKYGSTFNIYMFGQTTTVIGTDLAAEALKASDSQLSVHDAANDEIHEHPDIVTMMRAIPDDIAASIVAYEMFPIKWLARLMLPNTAAIDRHYQTIEKLIVPEIHRRRRASTRNDNVHPVDVLQFLINFCDKSGKSYTLNELPGKLMYFIHTLTENVSFSALHFLYDVAGRPEIRARLYREQQKVVAKHGTAFTIEALSDMQYMDACMRETLRMHVHALGTVRKARRMHTFSNGLSVPAGRRCMLHTQATNFNPEVYDSPSEYMPDRHLGKPGVHSTAIGPAYLIFGLGRHACPGRYYATAQMKMFVAWLLRRYDLTTRSGGRPENKTQNGLYSPVEEPIVFTLRHT
ncbi:cytochrome P450 [Thamnocephalis sphaerospora]|uniref:Cytochrome P450 n=1 Tax=Thamnocephalis sphaerospora TaxID=78915 RepID=A0A4V1IVR4_9FUNG|nr:cytochrome P450 [Thamnocephalis sphaerospora]|eukprot:RKP04969.1 cytochrome P450 [Thamnocephalis sphaerospora]